MKQSNGFTLIEVLVALAVLVGGILMISLAWSGNFLKMRKTALSYDVATLLERKMVEIEAKYKDKFKDLPIDGEEGDFGTEHSQYRWEMKVQELKFPDISAILIGQDGENKEMLISMVKQMTEYLGKTIKEVKVTIFVKGRGGKELEFSATQYMVDYSQDFAGAIAGAVGGGTPGK